MNGAQLKNSILQWAIQGKLVPQNPKDEPAQKLLERIAASRNESSLSLPKGTSSTSLRGPCKGTKQSKNPTSRIYRENGVWYEQVGTATPKDISDEIPFEIPENWAWCRMGDIIEFVNGRAYKKEELLSKGKYKVLRVGNFFTNQSWYFSDLELPEDKYCYNGDLLYAWSASFGPHIWNGDKTIFHYHIWNLKYDKKSLYREYLYYFFLYDKNQIGASTTGSTMIHVSMEHMTPRLIPLPPLAEQKRIVAKLEQVLPLAEEYGAAQEQLDKLNKELPEALKKSILQEAIQGKLVPQNPKDEPAQKLLERIAASRNESSLSLPKGTSSMSLRGAKATKQSKNPPSRIYRENGVWYEQIGTATPKDITDEIPFEIPETWAWCRLGSICDYLHRGKSPVYSDKKILPVMAQKCNQWDKIYTEKCLFADPKTIEKYTTEQYLQVGDVIINSTGGGTVGRTGFVDEYVFSEYDKFVADSHVTVVRSNKNVNPKYVYYFLITPLIQRGIEERCSGSTNQIELGTETVKNYLFPLPPLAEQKRIVTKLEQLFKVL